MCRLFWISDFISCLFLLVLKCNIKKIQINIFRVLLLSLCSQIQNPYIYKSPHLLQLILPDIIQLLLCQFYISECQHQLYVFSQTEKKNLCPNIPHQSWILPILICAMHKFFWQVKMCKIEAEFFVRIIKFCPGIFVKNQGLKYSPWKCATTKHVLAVLVPRVGTGYCSSIEGRDSAVGIATCYGLDGPGIDSRGVDVPHPSRPALGPTQLPKQWVPGLSRGRAAGVWRWPPNSTSAEVKVRVQLYFYSPSGPSWPVLGWTLRLHFNVHPSVFLNILEISLIECSRKNREMGP